jgi:hypothetical protein
VVDGFCETQAGVQSNFTSISTSTLTNGGAVNTMNFVFASVLTTAQKIKLVCALALNFQIDYTKVSTWDGYYCSELLNRRLLQEEDYNQNSRLLTAASSTVVVYFGVNTYTTSDTSRTTITAQANTSTLVSNPLFIQISSIPT